MIFFPVYGGNLFVGGSLHVWCLWGTNFTYLIVISSVIIVAFHETFIIFVAIIIMRISCTVYKKNMHIKCLHQFFFYARSTLFNGIWIFWRKEELLIYFIVSESNINVFVCIITKTLFCNFWYDYLYFPLYFPINERNCFLTLFRFSK